MSVDSKKIRKVPKIDLSNFDSRRDEIKEQLWNAATTHGFFCLVNQQFPSKSDILEIFQLSESFFKLSPEQKNKTPHIKLKNTGYEFKAQIRPSSTTKLPENKESLQMQLHRYDENWPNEEALGYEDWKKKVSSFILKVQELSMMILDIFSEKLGFEKEFLRRCHDIHADTAQSTLRFLHYFEKSLDVEGETAINSIISDDESKTTNWRCAPHTDFDVMTLLFCKEGDKGFEYCPGRESFNDFGYGDEWSSISPQTGEIVINIGDMLMSWSDDKLKSNFHRVRYVDDSMADRFSIAWFNQANTDVLIQGPDKRYEPVTGKEFIERAMKRNFDRLNGIVN